MLKYVQIHTMCSTCKVEWILYYFVMCAGLYDCIMNLLKQLIQSFQMHIISFKYI